MKLKPQPLGWIAAICTAVFIACGMISVGDTPLHAGELQISCGSVWNQQGRFSMTCDGTHLWAVIIMTIAAVTGLSCLVLLAALVLPGALRPENPDPAPQLVPTVPAQRQAAPRRLPVPDAIPAGWYPHPENPKLMRYWTGQTYGTVTRERRADE